MDQNKTNIPNFGAQEGNTDMTVRIIGVLCHGATNEAHACLITQENKNSRMLSFGAYLVEEIKEIKELIMNFLPIGHTHEDIGKCLLIY
jgi:hypothetical protein